MSQMIETILEELKANSDESTRASAQRFFKEPVKNYGVKANKVKQIGRLHYKKIKDIPKSELFTFCEELFKSGTLEPCSIACDWSYAVNKQYTPEDFNLFERWIDQYVNNWATCDSFCNHTMGKFVEMYPRHIEELKRLSTSDNRWLRRAAAVSLIIPAKQGMFIEDIFVIADQLLTDTDDMVQKGYGWMLKVATEKHENRVFEFVIARKQVMPRTALRYAIEKMQPALKTDAMKR